MNPSNNSSGNAAPIASSATCSIPGLLMSVLGSALPGSCSMLQVCSLSVVKKAFDDAPHEKVNSDIETFALRGLPDNNIIFTKSKIPYWFKNKGSGWGQYLDIILESELKSHGVIVNSFYDLESAYAEYFKKEMGRKLWLVGLGMAI
ncbi:soyasapogenol B glucuronide galactosyltransferase-like [Camellia sinensis]|uniref:soyasapogenol B glucuronide galactosyltransferase-like n=1 Tax=Camellia sinensis TaxID=4442 RepID=UPI00103697DB|nr:soyasapogenol B glucuronide galactosyltransferase-like [Camellia sinensis]